MANILVDVFHELATEKIVHNKMALVLLAASNIDSLIGPAFDGQVVFFQELAELFEVR